MVGLSLSIFERVCAVCIKKQNKKLLANIKKSPLLMIVRRALNRPFTGLGRDLACITISWGLCRPGWKYFLFRFETTSL